VFPRQAGGKKAGDQLTDDDDCQASSPSPQRALLNPNQCCSPGSLPQSPTRSSWMRVSINFENHNSTQLKEKYPGKKEKARKS
jgi:hypothetical protein